MKRNSLLILCMIAFAWGQDSIKTSRSCLDCHQSGTWFPLSQNPTFMHNSSTDFQLEYTHSSLKCTQCHTGESIEAFHQFNVKGRDCVSCHQDIHQNYWGNECDDCHSPENWDPGIAYRRHNETLFPLVGAHFSQDCYLCHSSPAKLPPIECQLCHEVDFVPELSSHAGMSNTVDCSNCHAPTRWNQILAINHGVFFPIYSGEHRGRWASCSTCHKQAGDYEIFTCMTTGCHTASHMNSEHCDGSDCEDCGRLTYPRTGVNSEDCYYCHPQGNKSKCGD